MKIDYAARARALVGVPFLAQGRGEGGLDCVGVVVETFGIQPETVRRNYRLRGDHLPEFTRCLDSEFRRIPNKQMRCGDLMLLAPRSDQLHLAVQTDRGFVHAHAGIRRVVETPGTPDWPLLGVYRKRSRR